ncbi:NAD-dependent epimerase/dehydratase family protein [Saccharothrix isguenensis]
MTDLAGRTVAVIGANGFLGAPLVDALLDRGANVRAFDRYSTGPRHRLPATVKVFQGDLLSRTSLAAAVAGAQDVFHFLSLTNPRVSSRDPMHDVTTNMTAGVELFSLCAANDVERVFFASSGGTVYGTAEPPHDEPCARNPVSPYGIGKVSLENYLRYFELEHGLKSVSLRISNPYGLGQKPRAKQGIIPIALRAARDGLALEQFGDGSMVRDYIYLPDLIDMVLRVWECHTQDTYNLGSGVGTPLSAVFDTVRQVTGLPLDITRVPCPPSFVQTSVLNTNRFLAEFDVPEPTSLEVGIAKTWDQVRSEVA